MATIPRELLGFLRDLADHNERAWFEANKKRYEREVKHPALALVAALVEPMAALSPHVQVVPKAQGGSLFRIHRDTRFSADKTPYKTHTGMQFRHEQASGDVHAPGYYLHLEPGGCGIGVGMWQPPNPVLEQVRQAIVADPDGWGATTSPLLRSGWTWMGEGLKRPPRGYDPDHVHIEDLKRKSFAMWVPLTDDQVCEGGFREALMGRFGEGAPLMSWLCGALALPF